MGERNGVVYIARRQQLSKQLIRKYIFVSISSRERVVLGYI